MSCKGPYLVFPPFLQNLRIFTITLESNVLFPQSVSEQEEEGKDQFGYRTNI